MAEWFPKEFNRDRYIYVKGLLRRAGVNTVCEEDLCPNRYYCYSHGTATFLVLGNICTRNCGYCNIKKGKPLSIDKEEPEKILRIAKMLGLKYVVITSVTRDDLLDGGTEQLARITGLLKNNGFFVELLPSDLRKDKKNFDRLIGAGADVIGLNIETVPRLYPLLRKGFIYDNILDVLKYLSGRVITKTSIIVGMGETIGEIKRVIDDIAGIVDILMIGQYIRPGKEQVPVAKYYSRQEFRELKQYGESLGLIVESGPLIRTSFKAFELFRIAKESKQVK